MKNASLIRYEIARIVRNLRTPEALAIEANKTGSKLSRLYVDLAKAERRELKALAARLNYKADIYYAGRRLYPTPGVSFRYVDSPKGPALFWGDEALDVSKLTNGHGQQIAI
jgi:hypothetical protein